MAATTCFLIHVARTSHLLVTTGKQVHTFCWAEARAAIMSSLRNAAKRKEHKERAQP